MKCEFFGCPITEGVRQRTIAPGTNVNLCDLCYEAEFRMTCENPPEGAENKFNIEEKETL